MSDELLLVRISNDGVLWVVGGEEEPKEGKRVTEEGGGAAQWRMSLWVVLMAGPFGFGKVWILFVNILGGWSFGDKMDIFFKG